MKKLILIAASLVTVGGTVIGLNLASAAPAPHLAAPRAPVSSPAPVTTTTAAPVVPTTTTTVAPTPPAPPAPAPVAPAPKPAPTLPAPVPVGGSISVPASGDPSAAPGNGYVPASTGQNYQVTNYVITWTDPSTGKTSTYGGSQVDCQAAQAVDPGATCVQQTYGEQGNG